MKIVVQAVAEATSSSVEAFFALASAADLVLGNINGSPMKGGPINKDSPRTSLRLPSFRNQEVAEALFYGSPFKVLLIVNRERSCAPLPLLLPYFDVSQIPKPCSNCLGPQVRTESLSCCGFLKCALQLCPRGSRYLVLEHLGPKNQTTSGL